MNKEMYGIVIEDMVANAFIELNKRNKERVSEISFDIIEKYGNAVFEKLEKDGKKVYFSLSNDNTQRFIINYSNYFTLKDDDIDSDMYSSIILNDDVEIDKLIVRFRTYLPLDLLMAYSDKETVKNGLLEPISLLKQENSIQKKLGSR